MPPDDDNESVASSNGDADDIRNSVHNDAPQQKTAKRKASSRNTESFTQMYDRVLRFITVLIVDGLL